MKSFQEEKQLQMKSWMFYWKKKYTWEPAAFLRDIPSAFHFLWRNFTTKVGVKLCFCFQTERSTALLTVRL